MQGMRDMMRLALARSLRTLSEEDRLAAAIPLVCGTALAAHCEVASLAEDRTLHLRVDGAEWLSPLLAMRGVLQHDLARVAGVPLSGLHFVQAGFAPDGPLRPSPSGRPQFAPGDQRPARRYTSSKPPGRPA